MADSLTRALRDHIIAYLTGEETLSDFHEWLVGATWDVEVRGEPQAVDLSYEIKLALAEHGRGDISLADLRERLSSLVDIAAADTPARVGVGPRART